MNPLSTKLSHLSEEFTIQTEVLSKRTSFAAVFASQRDDAEGRFSSCLVKRLLVAFIPIRGPAKLVRFDRTGVHARRRGPHAGEGREGRA